MHALALFLLQVLECVRRLLLTGLLVFLQPDSSGQLAFGCMFAFIRLLTNVYPKSYFPPPVIGFDPLKKRQTNAFVPTAAKSLPYNCKGAHPTVLGLPITPFTKIVDDASI